MGIVVSFSYQLSPFLPFDREWSYDVLPPTRGELMNYWRDKIFRLHALTLLIKKGHVMSTFSKDNPVPVTREERLQFIETKIAEKTKTFSDDNAVPCFFCWNTPSAESFHLTKLKDVGYSDNIWNYFPSCSIECRDQRNGISSIPFPDGIKVCEEQLYNEYVDGYQELERYLIEAILSNFIHLVKRSREAYDNFLRYNDLEVVEYSPLPRS